MSRLARRLALVAVSALLVLPMSGCEELCKGERSLLGFLLCDPSLVEEAGFEVAEFEVRLPPGRTLDTLEVGDTVTFQVPVPFEGNPLYPPGYIAREDWDFDGDFIYETRASGVGEPISHRFDRAGSFWVNVRLTDLEGFSDTTNTLVILRVGLGKRTKPRAELAVVSNPADTGERVSFFGHNSRDDGSIVEWAFDVDRNPDDFEVVRTEYSERPVEMTYDAPGEFPVRLRVTDNDGETDVAEVQMRVVTADQPPVAEFSYRPNPTFVGAQTTFDPTETTDPNNDVFVYEWDFDGDGEFDASSFPFNGEGGHFQHTYTAPGPNEGFTYLVRMRATDGEGNFDEVVHPVVVRPGDGSGPGLAFDLRRLAGRHAARPRAHAAKTHRFFARIEPRSLSAKGARGGRRALSGVLARGRVRGLFLTRGGRTVGPRPRALRTLLRGTWTTRLDLQRLAASRHRASALLLARGRGGGRVCARLALTTRGAGRMLGTLRVLGGSGAAARLRGTARFRFQIRPGYAVAVGTVRARSGRPRPMPAACNALRGR
jgi:hypothetical protein